MSNAHPDPVVQKGDRILYEIATGRIRYVLVVGIATEGGFPVFDGVVLDGHERGQVVWGYFSQVTAIESRDVLMVVTFRSGGIVVDRVKVRATTDDMAIERARAIAVSRAMVNDRAMPDVADAVVGVDLSELDQEAANDEPMTAQDRRDYDMDRQYDNEVGK